MALTLVGLEPQVLFPVIFPPSTQETFWEQALGNAWLETRGQERPLAALGFPTSHATSAIWVGHIF